MTPELPPPPVLVTAVADLPAEHPAALGACVVQAARTTVRAEALGWVERTTWEITRPDHAPCEAVEFVLPDGVLLTDWSGRVAALKRPDHPLDAARLRVTARPLGGAVARLLLPELDVGDQATVQLERTWTTPVDWRWLQEPVDFVEILVPKGIVVREQGFRHDGAWAWAEAPGPGQVLSLVHPWAASTPLPLPATAQRGLSADAALARVSELLLLPDAAFGREPLVGDAALAAGVADTRGVARTLRALAEDGPDEVAVGRWDAPSPPWPPLAPGAEIATARAEVGARILAHPQDRTAAGVVRAVDTPWGRVDQASAVDPHPTSTPPRWSGEVRIGVAGADPLRDVRRGGALAWRERSRAAWPADGRAHAVFLALPDDLLAVEDVSAPCVLRPDAAHGAWLVAPAGTVSCAFTLARRLDDAWDTLSPHLHGAPVHAAARWRRPDDGSAAGSVAVEGDTWRLGALADTVLITSRDRLVRELADRRSEASFPEPGLPRRDKLGLEGWDLAGALRDLVRARVQIRDDLAVVPGQPRPLHAVRRSGVASPEEAAAIAALYAGQERFQADVVLVHPGPGEPQALAPRGYTEAVVRLRLDGAEAWLDLRCEGCAPFAIRPDLHGRPALGPDGITEVPAR